MVGTICPLGWNRVNLSVPLSLQMWKANYNGFAVLTAKLVLKLLSKVKTKWEIFFKFLWLSQNI